MTEPTAARPRHVIWMTSDHMRYDHVAANGNPFMITPALDRMVSGGTSFDACYVQNPLCMPSRCSFMTGVYPPQSGVTHNGHCLPPDFEPHVATAFKRAGYQTAQIGKLHFQPHEELDFDPRPRHTYGFDVFWPSEERGNYSDPYYHWLEGKYPEYASALRVPRSTDPRRFDTEKNPVPVAAPWQATHAGWIVDTACNFLRRRTADPQFLHLGFYNPHPPLRPVREAWELYEDREPPPRNARTNEAEDKPAPLAALLQSRGDWSEEDFTQYRRGLGAMVTEMDLAIGWLLERLEELGILDDTLLVFSSDHGDFAGDHHMTHKAEAFYDEVMRVPLVMHWPNGLGGEARRVGGLVEKLDAMPTMLGLCGSTPPAAMQGLDLSPRLRSSEQADNIRDDVFAYHTGGRAMLRSESLKYMRYEDTRTEALFDLEHDPGELHNVANDPAYADRLRACRERLLSRMLVASDSVQQRIYRF